MDRRRLLIRVVPVAIALVVMWFQTQSAEKFTNEAGRTVRVALDPKQEAALGLQSYRQVLSQSQTLSTGKDYDLVRRCAERLAQATGESGKDFNWQVSLVRSPQVNAFCLPGGKICVYTGIIPVAKTENGLAVVMGHEMAHATLRHGSERLLQQKTTNTLMTGVRFSVGDLSYEQQRAVMGAIGAGAQYGFLLPFSREHESEADEIGLMYMAKAGYDPREAVTFWQRMSQQNGGQPMEFTSTHPSNTTRIENLKKLMPKALTLYQGSQGKIERP